MLDRTKNERLCVGVRDVEWLSLTKMERRLIRLYRQLSEQEQGHLRRISEVLATHPEEPTAS